MRVALQLCTCLTTRVRIGGAETPLVARTTSTTSESSPKQSDPLLEKVDTACVSPMLQQGYTRVGIGRPEIVSHS